MNTIAKSVKEATQREDGLTKAIAIGAGALVAGGAAWWAWSRTRRRGRYAPGWPGAPPRWSVGAKDGVGTPTGLPGATEARVWFTFSQGVLAEVFYPRIDEPSIRGLGLVVADGLGYFSDERCDARHETSWWAEGVPAFQLVNTCSQGRYRIEKAMLAHPHRNAVLQRITFERQGKDDYLFLWLDPHLGNRGGGNSAWVGRYKGLPMLFAERGRSALALACSAPWGPCSAGFAGSISDGLADVRRHGRMTRFYTRAERGNVLLTAGVDLRHHDGPFVLALGFGSTPAEAAQHARASLLDDVDTLLAEYTQGWRRWQDSLRPAPPSPGAKRDLYAVSAAVLRTHEDKIVPGAIVASLSIPWGAARGDRGTGPVGYHVVWPRDLVEIAGGLVAIGAGNDTLRVLRYLQATQENDGHWPQNQWVDGHKAWDSIQVGETALPVLLVNLLMREGMLKHEDLIRFWPMVRAAARYILTAGPSSQEDRWENARGFSPFTLSVLVASLVVAADVAEAVGEPRLAAELREAADTWNDNLEYWTYVEGTELARRVGVRGYYLRIAPPGLHGEPAKRNGEVDLWYRSSDQGERSPSEIVSPDALAFVRFGLRAADDRRILDTLKVVDAILKVETPSGPAWHRYSGDGYGEKADGSPFDQDRGLGRAWPLLTGERAHYELAAGRPAEAARLMHAMEAFAGPAGMIPEQVWDAPDIPERGLYFGRPSGSAMPLAWAHAEYLKLRRSLAEGRVFDTPPQTVQRYLVERTVSPFIAWRLDHQRRIMPAGKALRIELLEPAAVIWQVDGGAGPRRERGRDTGLGLHVFALSTSDVPAGADVRFTIEGMAKGWSDAGKSFVVRVT